MSSKKKRTSAGVNRTPSNLRNFEKESLDQKDRFKLGLEAAKLRLDADARETRLSANGSAERKRIKELRAQARDKEQENVAGYRLIPAPSLFSDKAKQARGEKRAGNGKGAQTDKKDDIARAGAADAATAAN